MTKASFDHPSIHLDKSYPLVYTAMSKHLFYYRMFISKFVIEAGAVPLNPFMIYDYFLLDSVDRDLIRGGNNSIVRRADEIWVFGPISDGVLAEIQLAQTLKKPLRYFLVEKSHRIVESTLDKIPFDDEAAAFREQILASNK